RRMLRTEVVAPADGDEVLEFSGTPGSLRGRLPLRNLGGRRLMLTRVDVVPATVSGDAAVAGATTVRIGRAVVLDVDETRDVPVTLRLDPHTLPGRYELELEVAGQVRRAVVTVTEQVALDLQPTSLLVENRP